jgi:Recombination endonuclease VII
MSRPLRIMIDDKLLCCVCKEFKSPEYFYINNSATFKRDSRCIECKKNYAKTEIGKTIQKRYSRVSHFRKYGLTPKQFHSMRQNQEFCCAVCGIDEDELDYGLDIDHNHLTGKVRGLLCNTCNNDLKKHNDDIDSIGLSSNAILYLNNNPGF